MNNTRSSTQRLDDRTYCARSAFTHLGLWRKLYDCSLHHFTTNQFILKMCSIGIFDKLKLVVWNFKGGLLTSGFGCLGVHGGRGLALSIALPWVPISSKLTVYLLPFLSYLADSKSVFARLSNPDTINNCQIPLRKPPRQKQLVRSSAWRLEIVSIMVSLCDRFDWCICCVTLLLLTDSNCSRSPVSRAPHVSCSIGVWMIEHFSRTSKVHCSTVSP